LFTSQGIDANISSEFNVRTDSDITFGNATADFALSAAVAEFKGPEIHGVVRFVQVSMELARIEASFSGLPPGSHGWSINEYGDLTQGAASTGQIFNTSTNQQDVPVSVLCLMVFWF